MKNLLMIISLFCTTFAMLQAAVNTQDVSGTYVVKYKTFWTGEASFEITLHKLVPGQAEGDIDFYSEKFGKCSNVSQSDGAPEYGYTFYNTDDVLTDLVTTTDRRNVITTTIFCGNVWYNVVIELPLEVFQNGELEAPVGFYFLDANFKIPLQGVGKMTKIL